MECSTDTVLNRICPLNMLYSKWKKNCVISCLNFQMTGLKYLHCCSFIPGSPILPHSLFLQWNHYHVKHHIWKFNAYGTIVSDKIRNILCAISGNITGKSKYRNTVSPKWNAYVWPIKWIFNVTVYAFSPCRLLLTDLLWPVHCLVTVRLFLDAGLSVLHSPLTPSLP